jgi:hypothetical protein
MKEVAMREQTAGKELFQHESENGTDWSQIIELHSSFCGLAAEAVPQSDGLRGVRVVTLAWPSKPQ